MRLKRFILIKILIMIVILCLSGIVSADDFDEKYTYFLGPAFSYGSISGSFAESHTLQIWNSTLTRVEFQTSLPRIIAGLGYGLLGGIKIGNTAFEASYLSASNEAYYDYYDKGKIFVDAEINTINVNGKYLFLEESALQPFFQLGIAFTWMRINLPTLTWVSTVDTMVSRSEGVTFYGIGLNLGGGIMYNISDFSINLGLNVRTLLFSEMTTDGNYVPTTTNPKGTSLSGGLETYTSISVLYNF